MAGYLNKSGRAQMFSCSWPAYLPTTGPMKVQLHIMVSFSRVVLPGNVSCAESNGLMMHKEVRY